jgi:hypothetical protein
MGKNKRKQQKKQSGVENGTRGLDISQFSPDEVTKESAASESNVVGASNIASPKKIDSRIASGDHISKGPEVKTIPDVSQRNVAADCDTGISSQIASSPVGTILEEGDVDVSLIDGLLCDEPVVGPVSFSEECARSTRNVKLMSQLDSQVPTPALAQETGSPPSLLENKSDCLSAVTPATVSASARSSVPTATRSALPASTTTTTGSNTSTTTSNTEVGIIRGYGYRYIALAVARLVGLVERAMVHTIDEIGKGCGIKKSLLRMVSRRPDGDISTYVRQLYSDLSGREGGDELTLQDTNEKRSETESELLFLNPNDVSLASDTQVLRIVLVSLLSCFWAAWELVKTVIVAVLCTALRTSLLFVMRLTRKMVTLTAWLVFLPVYFPLYILKAIAYRIFPDLANTHTCVVTDSTADEASRVRVQAATSASSYTGGAGSKTEMADTMARLGTEAARRANSQLSAATNELSSD